MGAQVSLSEAEMHWREFFKDLHKRGLHGVKLTVNDAHHGIKVARKAVMPNVAWQCCQFHLQKNAQSYVTKRDLKSKVACDIQAIFNATNQNDAKHQLDLFVERYKKSIPKLSQWAENNTPKDLTVFGRGLCEFNKKRLRTSNIIERLNQTVKQQTKIANIFANKESCLRLVSAIVIEASEQSISGRIYLKVE